MITFNNYQKKQQIRKKEKLLAQKFMDNIIKNKILFLELFKRHNNKNKLLDKN